MPHQYLEISRENKIGLITICRPESLNALNRGLLSELNDVFHQFEEDPEVRAFIITGSGEKAFASGADINELEDLTPAQGYELVCFGQDIFNYLEEMGTPSIAAVNGYALGGGCELAMACDLRVASSTAKFGQPEIRLGNIPGWGGTQRLPRLIGKARAKELILTGKFITAEDAKEIGLVNHVVPPEQLLSAAKKLASEIASKGAIAVRLAKTAINQGTESDLRTGLRIEAQGVAICFSTRDQKEGVRAFLEKRNPVFEGR